MQDYNYIFAGCYEITLEISCCKFPLDTELSFHWQKNRDALLYLTAQAHLGMYAQFAHVLSAQDVVVVIIIMYHVGDFDKLFIHILLMSLISTF